MYRHLRTQKKPLFLTIGMKLVQNAVFYIYSVFVLSYLVTTHRYRPLRWIKCSDDLVQSSVLSPYHYGRFYPTKLGVSQFTYSVLLLQPCSSSRFSGLWILVQSF